MKHLHALPLLGPLLGPRRGPLLGLRAAAALVAIGFVLGAPAHAQRRPGSIYDPVSGPGNMMADKKAAKPGDLLTILISESQDVQNTESSDLSKIDSLDYKLDVFDIKPNLFNTLPGVTGSMTDNFKGTANYQKKGNLQARVTVIVVDALPNGNLVVQGRREIRIDDETKVIAISGVVRRYDVTSLNTVESELVANARVAYIGSGPLTRGTNRSTLGEIIVGFFAWLWPF